MTFVDPIEHDLIEAGDPRFVRPSGDCRERSVPCAGCRRPTLAIRGPLCATCDPPPPPRRRRLAALERERHRRVDLPTEAQILRTYYSGTLHAIARFATTLGVCGHDYGDDPHIEPDGRTFCADCCRRPGCNPVSTPTAVGVDAATGVPDAPAPVGSAQDAAPVAAPLADKE